VQAIGVPDAAPSVLFRVRPGRVFVNTVTGLRKAGTERLRIARELHDSLTHNISLIKMQAGIAFHLAHERGEPVPEGLLAIQEAGQRRDARATCHPRRPSRHGRRRGGHGLRPPRRTRRAVARGRSPPALTILRRAPYAAAEVDRTRTGSSGGAHHVTRAAGDAAAWADLAYRPDA